MSRTTDKNAGGVESVLALVLYFAREGYWHHVQTVADQVIKKRGRAPVLSFWKASAVAREGEYAAAIRDFDDLRTKREVSHKEITYWSSSRYQLGCSPPLCLVASICPFFVFFSAEGMKLTVLFCCCSFFLSYFHSISLPPSPGFFFCRWSIQPS